MIPLFRTIGVIVGALRASRLQMPDGVSRITLRVWPNDLDFNRHMNNGRYLMLMDLGRIDLMLRAGLAGPLFRGRWTPVLTGATIRYRRSLTLFQRVRLESSIAGWNRHSIFIRQNFVILSGRQAGEVAATATVRASLIEPGATPRKIEIAAMFAHLGLAPVSPPIPDALGALTGDSMSSSPERADVAGHRVPAEAAEY